MIACALKHGIQYCPAKVSLNINNAVMSCESNLEAMSYSTPVAEGPIPLLITYVHSVVESGLTLRHKSANLITLANENYYLACLPLSAVHLF